MTITRAEASDFSQLKELWSIVFSEEPEFLEKFFSLRFFPENIFVAREQGKIISALHALPSFYQQNNRIQRCAYIVGAATYIEFRKQGIMSALLTYTKQQLKCPITLFPAIRPFYETNGYLTTSEMLCFNLQGLKKYEPGTLVNPTKEELNSIYLEATRPGGNLLRDNFAWQFLLDGYSLLAVKDAYAFIKDNKAVETMAKNKDSAIALLGLLEKEDIKSCSVLHESPFTELLITQPFEVLPMGMSTDATMQGCYIAEQY
ncbi:GNAT family N-acetyltransferase [uncultured Sphaerochaeta sp.]|uniref:GNAT family N-acetyltransferase n=1 Tax=uncultured Sphaerochaeta sp. TaxID=886478 RepID=UPI002A0A9644|nr:GNAT family N-acetyltransferase [uncultured Sphaerochaeta sp.]